MDRDDEYFGYKDLKDKVKESYMKEKEDALNKVFNNKNSIKAPFWVNESDDIQNEHMPKTPLNQLEDELKQKSFQRFKTDEISTFGLDRAKKDALNVDKFVKNNEEINEFEKIWNSAKNNPPNIDNTVRNVPQSSRTEVYTPEFKKKVDEELIKKNESLYMQGIPSVSEEPMLNNESVKIEPNNINNQTVNSEIPNQRTQNPMNNREAAIPKKPETNYHSNDELNAFPKSNQTFSSDFDFDTSDIKKKNKKSKKLSWLIDIAVALVVAVAINFFFTPTIVKEHSMDTTLADNDYLILFKKAYWFSDIKRGDILTFKSDLKYDDGSNKNLIKRVIGLPGDIISIKDGKVYRNNVLIKENYIKDGTTNGELDNVRVPDGELFMMGDNRLVSLDSRDPSVGFVPINRIVGKAIFRFFPLTRFGGIYNKND